MTRSCKCSVSSPPRPIQMAGAAAIARAYEARKKELAEEAAREAGQKPWYDALLQMFGLKPAAPDPDRRGGSHSQSLRGAKEGTCRGSSTRGRPKAVV